MEKWTIDYLRKNNLIIYEYRRGSHMYHLNVATSDEDTGGVFICPKEMLLGLRSGYVEQVSDEKNDTVFYEFGRWIELLMKSNPTALESLYAPDDCIIGEMHPIIKFIRDNRDSFLSKECFKTFYGYAVSQIGKARGLNKKIVNPVTERKDILDFCYTFQGQGSKPIKDWLKENKLDQKYCGLVNLPNMKDAYGVYFDFASYFKFEFVGKGYHESDFEKWVEDMGYINKFYDAHTSNAIGVDANRVRDKKFFHYSGIVKPKDMTIHNPDGTSTILHFDNFNDSETGVISDSNTVRLSSIPRGESPICYMTYNKDGYTSHCREYKEYKEWEEKRNPVRYESNLNKNYDSKNVMHCMRLVRMAKELAQGKGFNVVRTFDRDYLLDIRNHKYEYEEVMEQLEKEKAEMEDAIAKCTLPNNIDYNVINKLLIDARNQFYGF